MKTESPHSRACGIKPHEHGYDCHSNCPTCHGVPMAHFAEGGTDLDKFIAWADAQPAVTWAGRLGLKERWERRDDPEYQEMLKKMGTR